MGRGRELLVGVVLLGITAWVPPARSAEFASCADVQEYFKNALPPGPYARVQDLEKAVEILKRESTAPPESCEDWVVERGLFEYATALDEYSQTFSGDPQAIQRWASEAAAAYGGHLDWFLNLSMSRQNRLIGILTKTQRAPEEEFKEQRGKWLRSRVGNVLNSLGSTLVRAGAHEELFAAYDRCMRIE